MIRLRVSVWTQQGPATEKDYVVTGARGTFYVKTIKTAAITEYFSIEPLSILLSFFITIGTFLTALATFAIAVFSP